MKKRLLLAALTAVIVAGGGAWLYAETSADAKFGALSADPAYVVVNTPTPVTVTAVISDSSLRRHDPRGVLLVRTDASGRPVEILGRMRDNGRRADAKRKDTTYTTRVTLTEQVAGPVHLRVAARFRQPLPEKNDISDDWDRDLAGAVALKDKNARRDRQTKLLGKLGRYVLSDSVQVTVDPFKLPPDPGDAGKQTLEGIDTDRDGVRDDVQRIIAYSAFSPEQRDALMQSATSLLLNISGPALDNTLETRSTRCLIDVFGANRARDELRLIRSVVLNTPARLRSYLTALDHLTMTSPAGSAPGDTANPCAQER